MNAVILFIADGYFTEFRQSQSVSIGAFKYLCHVNIYVFLSKGEAQLVETVLHRSNC